MAGQVKNCLRVADKVFEAGVIMSDKLATQIEKIVRKAAGIEHGPVVLHEPFFNGNERQYVTDCIDTNWVSTVGK